eukprot:9489911-Pyramimonas_sp.AAC.1
MMPPALDHHQKSGSKLDSTHWGRPRTVARNLVTRNIIRKLGLRGVRNARVAKSTIDRNRSNRGCSILLRNVTLLSATHRLNPKRFMSPTYWTILSNVL